VTPVPVNLDGHAHTVTIPLEAVAADVGPGSTYTLQITDGTDVYFAARSAGLVNLSKISVSVPTVAPGASQVVTGTTPSGTAGTGGATGSGGATGTGGTTGTKRATALGSFSCAKPTGRIAGRSLGPVTLGMTRARARRPFKSLTRHGRRDIDLFCPTHGGIRVGYASPAVVRELPARQRARTRNRAVLILTGNHHYAIKGVRPATPLSAARHHLKLARPFHIGLDQWYLASDGAVRAVLKVRHGEIDEIGIAGKPLTATRASAAKFLRSFS
jgi:hypothetical protein